MHVPPPHAAVKAATGTTAGPVKVLLAGVAKSTWNFHRFSAFEPKFTTYSGEPAGGAMDPSRSEASRPP